MFFDKFFAGVAVFMFENVAETANQIPFGISRPQLPLLAQFFDFRTTCAFTLTAPHLSNAATNAATDTINPACSNIFILNANMLNSRPEAGAT